MRGNIFMRSETVVDGEAVRSKREEEDDMPTVYAIENLTAPDNTAAFRRFTEECYDGAFEQKLEDAINSTKGNEFVDVMVKTEPGEQIKAESDSSKDDSVQLVGESCTLNPNDAISAIGESLMASSDDRNRSPETTSK